MSDARQVAHILRAAADAAQDDAEPDKRGERVDAGAYGIPPHLRPLGPVPEIPGELMLR